MQIQRYFASLKAQQRLLRDGFGEALTLRVHRAISWLGRAEQEEDDADARFIFLWISFNAAYANDLPERKEQSEYQMFSQFLQKLIDLDQEGKIYNLLWSKYSSSIRLILDNPYVYQPFWDFHSGRDGGGDWETRFAKSKAVAQAAIAKRDALTVLNVVLGRLYVLRNQLVHGGSTWNSQVNRAQINDGANFLHDLIPVIVTLMMTYPNELWGDASYPVISK